MKTTKILDEETFDLRVSSLPTRPTSDGGFGGRGFSAKEMKQAFDRLPLFIIERFNTLVDDLFEDDGIAGEIKTGITDSHTLTELFGDITSGILAGYLTVGERTLAEQIASLDARISALEGGGA